MGKDKKTPVVINNKEYFAEDLTDQQKSMLNHIQDLDRKLKSAKFNVDQLSVGREAFISMLSKSLENVDE
jgi:hypothetical protein|tara:strand:- start:40 stop:249 length:210 start_codon:yes stop_codon:yes gene_type:complete